MCPKAGHSSPLSRAATHHPWRKDAPFHPRRASAVLALVALSACSDAPTASRPADPARTEDLRALVTAAGFRGDLVQDFGSYVLVEGDIRLTREELRAMRLPSSGDPRGPRFQYRTTNLVGSPKIQQIVVSLAGVTGTVWETPARDALAQWNAISGSYVKMVEGSPADISISTTCTSSNVAAFASFPSGGNPGATVYANSCFGYSIGYSARLRNMVHELGHTIGFRHTNYTQQGETAGTDGAIQISGTPTSGGDGSSVMNGGTALSTWAGFSSYDQTATRNLYPLPYPSASGSHPGSTFVVSWSAAPGAEWYEVENVEEYSITDYETGSSATRYESGWVMASGLSYNTGATWTGTSNCIWLDSMYRTERSDYYVAVRGHFANGYGPANWVYDETHTC